MIETPKRLEPTKETIRFLFSKTGNQCAFPGCSHSLFQADTFLAEVCHISAVKETGARFNDKLTNEDRRKEDNLIVLCRNHHSLIDNDEFEYDTDKVLQMKREHEGQFTNAFDLSEKQMKSVESSLQIILESLERIESHLGTRNSKGKEFPEQVDFDQHFSKFLNDETDFLALFLKAQPTIEDCKRVFHEDYYLDIYEHYSHMYRELCVDPVRIRKEGDKISTEYKSYEYKLTPIDEFNSWMKERDIFGIKVDLLRKGIQMYDIRFLKNNDDRFGVSFNFWLFRKGRWVFFPKPNRVMRNINSIRSDDDLRALVKVIKGMNKIGLLPKEFLSMPDARKLSFTQELVRQLKKK